MFRLWAKIFRENRLLRDTVICDGSDDTRTHKVFRALEERKVPRTAGIKLRYGDFSTLTMQTTPNKPIYSSSDVFQITSGLLREKYSGGGVRLLGVFISGIYDGDDVEQPDFFSGKVPEKALPVGTVLRAGAAELVVTQIGKECHTACEIRRLTGRCAMPTEGIFCVVTRGGTVRAGDSLEVVAR